MSCARTRRSVGPLRWTWQSTCSTACWSWDARTTSAWPNPGRVGVIAPASLIHATQPRAMLQGALSGLVGAPLTKIETIEQMRAARGDDRPSSALDLPPEVQTQVVHAMLDKHYRALLDEPIA